MSIFRGNSQSAELSALLDGELSPGATRVLSDALNQDAHQQSEYARIRDIHAMMTSHPVSAEQVSTAQDRVRVRLDRSIHAVHHRDQRPWWERSIAIPLPMAATAMVAVLIFAGIFASQRSSAAIPDSINTAQTTADTVADSVNVQVNVNGDQTEQLLKWLNERQSVETVTIQLPDTAQFQLRGEPVFMRPDLPGEYQTTEAYADAGDGAALDITPLEGTEE